MTDGSFQRADAATEAYPASSAARGQGEERGFSLIAAAAVLLHHRWLVLLVPLAFGVLVVGMGLTRPRTYSSSASFIPQQTDASSASGLSGIAAQFGVNIGQGSLGQSPAFYADLITSRPILEGIVDTTYVVPIDGVVQTTTLQKALGIDAATGRRAREQTIRALRPLMRVTTDAKTGVVGFTVTTRWPELSDGIERRILALINEFNISTRRSQATAQRDFAQSRLEASKGELRQAEAELQGFMQRNRSYVNDPQLLFEHDRLNREVQLRQQIYMSLAQSFEQSRLDAVRNTPMITVIERPEPSPIPNGRNLLLKAIAAAMAGFLAVAGFLVGREALRSNAETARDLEGINREIEDMLEPLQRLRSRGTRQSEPR